MNTQISIQKKLSFAFSPQQIVDCDTVDGGCNGGWPGNVFAYASKVYLVNNATYPYIAKSSTCQFNQTVASANAPYKVAISGTTQATCAALLAQIKKSPLVVALDGGPLQLYKSGIYSGNGTSVTHAVLLVGVDSCSNWIIQNSWGATWGENGYARLQTGNTLLICKYGGFLASMM